MKVPNRTALFNLPVRTRLTLIADPEPCCIPFAIAGKSKYSVVLRRVDDARFKREIIMSLIARKNFVSTYSGFQIVNDRGDLISSYIVNEP